MDPIEIDQAVVVEVLAGKLAVAQTQVAQLEVAVATLQRSLRGDDTL